MGDISLNKKNDAKPKKKWRKVLGFLLKAFLGLIAGTMLFIAGLSFSAPFRKFVLSKVAAVANNFFVADFEIQDIHFHTLNGIVLQEVRIITAGDTLAYIPEIEININYEKIFINIIDIDFIKLKSPRIKLLRSNTDSLWNYSKIVKPSKPDTTPSGAAPAITVGNFYLENAYFAMWDSTSIWQPNANINFKKFIIDELNLSLADTKINISEHDFRTSIDFLSAKELLSGFILDKLKMDARLSEAGIEAKNTEIKIQKTELAFDASMLNFNLFGESEEKDIAKAQMFIDIEGEEINPEFIDNFAKIPIEIGNINKLELQAEGTLMDLKVGKIMIDAYNSHIELTDCNTTNLLEPENLTYASKINSSKIKYADLNKILKNINFSSVPDFTNAFINNTNVYGTLDSVYADVDIKTGIGSVLGYAGIGFRKNPFSFDVNLKTSSINLATLLKNNDLISDLNCNILILGSGIKPEEIDTKVEIDLFPSRFNEYYFGNSKISFDIKRKDTLIINNLAVNQINAERYYTSLKNDTLADEEIALKAASSIILNGGIGLKNINKPHFDIQCNLHNLNLKKILRRNFPDNMSTIPNSVSADFDVDITGLNLDELEGKFSSSFNYIEFENKNMLPFGIDGNITENDSNNRSINLNMENMFGEVLSLDISGKYSINNLIESLTNHAYSAAHFFTDKIETLSEQFNPDRQKSVLPEIYSFPDANVDIAIQANDLSLVSFFINDFTSNSTNIGIKMNFNSLNSISELNISELNLKNIDVLYGNKSIKIKNLELAAQTKVEIIDSLPHFNRLNLDLKNGRSIDIAGNKIDSLFFKTDYDKNNFNIKLNGIYNAMLKAELMGGFSISNENMNLFMNDFSLNYQNVIWHNSKQILIDMTNNGITVKDFSILRDNREEIVVSGNMKNNSLNNVNISVNNFEIRDLNTLFLKNPEFDKLKLYGKLDSLNILINGTLDEPIIDLGFNLNNIKIDKQLIGRLHSNFKYSNEILAGNSQIFSSSDVELLNLEIKKLPIYIGMAKDKQLFIDDRELDISLLLSKLPAQIVQPFVPMVDNMRGLLSGNLNIGGTLPDTFTYSGEINVDNLSLRLMQTNVEYTTYGKINIETDKILLHDLKIRNQQHDLKGGEAVVNGSILLKKFNLDYIDISLTSRKFLVLNERTEVVMPWFYGNLVIATDDKPLRFYGTMDEPNLSGSAVILNADMKMPQLLDDEMVKRKTKFTYLTKDTIRMTIISYIDSTAIDTAKNNAIQQAKASTASFVDLLNIDISVKIKRCAIDMALKGMGMVNIYAKIGTVQPMAAIRYVKYREQAEAKLYGGELAVLSGSTVSIGRTMSAKGTISFPTARLSQPHLNLVAEAKGRMLDGSNNYTNYVVTIHITGTANQPIMKLSYSINGVEKTGDQKQIEEEAYTLLITGKLADFSSESNLTNDMSNMAVSQVASRALNDFVGHMGGIVESASVQFEGEGFNAAEVRISGSILGIANWSVGGKFENINSNYTASIDIPININKKALDNLMLQISKSTDINASSITDEDATNWEIKLKLGGSW